jgi:hypothetical protein
MLPSPINPSAICSIPYSKDSRLICCGQRLQTNRFEYYFIHSSLPKNDGLAPSHFHLQHNLLSSFLPAYSSTNFLSTVVTPYQLAALGPKLHIVGLCPSNNKWSLHPQESATKLTMRVHHAVEGVYDVATNRFSSCVEQFCM